MRNYETKERQDGIEVSLKQLQSPSDLKFEDVV